MKVNIIIWGFFMSRIYKKHGGAFKSKVALEAIKEQKTLGQLSQEYSVASTQISTWKKHLEENASILFEVKQEKNHKEEVDKLHRIIGQITAERDFLERALSR
jgi:transposase